MDHTITFCYIDFAAKCIPGAPDPDGAARRAARWPGVSVGVRKRVRALHIEPENIFCFNSFGLKSSDGPLYSNFQSACIFPSGVRRNSYGILALTARQSVNFRRRQKILADLKCSCKMRKIDILFMRVPIFFGLQIEG